MGLFHPVVTNIKEILFHRFDEFLWIPLNTLEEKNPQVIHQNIVDSEKWESTKSAAELKITTRDLTTYNYILAISTI